MGENIPPRLIEVLNYAVHGKIENFNIALEDRKLEGENFLGDIAFATLTNISKKEDLKLVIKQRLTSPEKLQIFFEAAFKNEINFYGNVWPLIYEFGKNNSIDFNKFAKFYNTKSPDQIVLEDLRQKEFKMIDKTKTFDKQHLEFILKTYGVFHAISFAFKERNSEEYSKLQDSLKNFSSVSFELFGDDEGYDFLKEEFEYILEHIFGTNDKKISKLLEKYKFADLYKNSSKHDIDSSVLVHGDCWSNNLMFKYTKEGKLEDMRFLDFQFAAAGTPVHDISYCMYSGGSKEIFDRFDDYLKIWYDSFSETLQKLNCNPQKPYTLETLQSEWKGHCGYGFAMAVMIWGKKLAADLEKNNLEEYSKRIKELVYHMHERNFL